MANKTVSGTLFKQMVTNGAVNLKNNHKEIDHLNVFPVPDGDTGTNMQMTMMAGIKEVNKINTESIVDISKILSRGLLMGARGNSGVILSQFFRGLYSEIAKIDNGSATVDEFIQALVGGYEMAYRAVMDPVEGTILTVVRESAERVLRERAKINSVEDVLKVYLKQAKATLLKTPDLLPVLKEAGVVDSGGAGFIKIIEGWVSALQGEEINELYLTPDTFDHPHTDHQGAHVLGDIDIKYGFCTEFIVKLFDWEKFDEKLMQEPLSRMGDSLVVVTDEDILKIHVHTNQPGVALTLAQKYGDLQTIKIDNMRIQHDTIMNLEPETPKLKEKTKYAIVAVASGEGIHEAFKELGVTHIIEGGQTMNPSTEDFVKAIESLNADNIILLPNNSNIILTAEQTVELMTDQNIRVVKSKNIAQGYASLIAFDPGLDADENVEQMVEAIDEMRSGEVTYSIRDTEINGLKISKDDFIGITAGNIVVSEKTNFEAADKLIKNLIFDDCEIITIFYGNQVSEEEVEKLVESIYEFNNEIEVETVSGKQEVYSYIISVE